MDHKYLSIDNVSLAYIEKNAGEKETIFFIHGNSMSSGMWEKQFASNLFSKYRLIAFDLPAHGNSAVPENYEIVYKDMLPYLAGIISKAVKKLAPKGRYFLTGLSLGSNIIAEMLNFEINPVGIALISPDIFGEDYPLTKIFKDNADIGMFFTDEPAEISSNIFFSEASPIKKGPETDSLIIDYTKVKSPFRSSLLNYGNTAKLKDEVMILHKYCNPLFLLFGKDDQFTQTDYLDAAPLNIMNNTIHKIENAGHYVNMEQPRIFNRLLAEYFNAVSEY